MIKLNLNDSGKETTIYADEKRSKGIYLAFGLKEVEMNINALDINFNPIEGFGAQFNVSKRGTWAFVTLKAFGKYTQYIIMESASEEDFAQVLVEAAELPELQQQLVLAFSTTRRLPLG